MVGGVYNIMAMDEIVGKDQIKPSSSDMSLYSW